VSIDRIAEHLARVDKETLDAFERAARSACFCCEVMTAPDSYQRSEVAGAVSFGSKDPGPYLLGWGRSRVIRLLGSVANVEDAMAHRLDMAREKHDHSQPGEQPRGVAGRPVTIKWAQVDEVRKLAAAGVRVSRIAHAGVMPARTFWSALRRGKSAVNGIERDLFIAVYGEGGTDGPSR